MRLMMLSNSSQVHQYKMRNSKQRACISSQNACGASTMDIIVLIILFYIILTPTVVYCERFFCLVFGYILTACDAVITL